MNIFAPQGGGLWRRASSGRVVYPNAGQQQRFALVGMATTGLVALLAVCLRAAPVFTLSILGIITIVLLYILTEHWKTHDAVEFQNRFWSLVAFVFAWVCFFIRDSPLRFSERNSHFAWICVFLFSYAAHNYDRHLRRLVLSKVPRLPRVASADIDQELKTAARYKIAELKKYTTVIDNPYVSSTFQNVVNIFKVLHAEQNIITIFEEASKDELNYILPYIELGLIFYKMKDHKWWRRYYRTKLLRILAVDRLHELNVRSKVYLLHGIQSLTLSANELGEKLVLGILSNTKGEALSELKSLADAKGDVFNMHKLVYQDIRSVETQTKILAHIKNQADFLNSHFSLRAKQTGTLSSSGSASLMGLGLTSSGGPSPKPGAPQAWRKIISDVDDTLTCSGGASHSFGLAGIDTSYPAKTVYPGVVTFYRELDLGTTGIDTWDDTKVGNLVFLSARPHVYKDATEALSYEKFRNLPLHTMPTLLAGALDTGFKFAYEGDAEHLAVTKFKNLQEYLSLYPEYRVLFVGDNGQGDVRAAEMALSSPEYCNNIHRVYVHLVQPSVLTHRGASAAEQESLARAALEDGSPQSSDIEGSGRGKSGVDRALSEDRRRRQLREREKMCFFITYVDAALDAQAFGLIRTSGLRNVMADAVKDFEAIRPERWAAEEERAAAQRHAARVATSKNGMPPAQGAGGRVLHSVGPRVKALSAARSASISSASSVSSRTASPSSAPTASASASAAAPSSAPASAASLATPTASSVWACYGENKRETRIRELNLSLQRGNTVLEAAGFPPVSLLDRKFVTGCPVRTEYGLGVLTRIRKNTTAPARNGYFGATFEVLVQWDSSGCARPVKLFLQDWAIVSVPPLPPPPKEVAKYFPPRSSAAKKAPAPVVLGSAVNLPPLWASFSSEQQLGAGPLSVGKKAARIGMLTRESVAALPVAQKLVPLPEKGEGSTTSVSSSSRSQRESASASASVSASTKAHAQPVPLTASREEDVPSIDVVIQTSVFKPSVMDRARNMFITRTRARSSSKHSISSDGADERMSNASGATGQMRNNTSTTAVGGERDLSAIRGAQAWTPFGLAEIIGYSDEEGRDIVHLRLHMVAGYMELFLHRSCVVQLTAPIHTRCYPDEALPLSLFVGGELGGVADDSGPGSAGSSALSPVPPSPARPLQASVPGPAPAPAPATRSSFAPLASWFSSSSSSSSSSAGATASAAAAGQSDIAPQSS